MNAQTSTNYGISRRLTKHLSKAFRYWSQDSTEGMSSSKLSLRNFEEKKYFSIEDLVSQTKFTRLEVQFIYRDFKQKCPRGILNERALVEIYSQYFSCGDCTIYAKHLFSAMIHQHYSSIVQNLKPKRNLNLEINFQQFIITLSTIMRGNIDEKIRWLFNFYDLNKDGRISKDEIKSMITSIYDLMGEYVSPPVDETTRDKHVASVLKKMGLTSNPEKSLTYEEFHQIFITHDELIESMMDLF